VGDAIVLRSTVKALLVELVDHGRELWVPKSVLHEDSAVYDDGENSQGELVLVAWFARKEGLD
jgi:hypothetical protein